MPGVSRDRRRPGRRRGGGSTGVRGSGSGPSGHGGRCRRALGADRPWPGDAHRLGLGRGEFGAYVVARPHAAAHRRRVPEGVGPYRQPDAVAAGASAPGHGLAAYRGRRGDRGGGRLGCGRLLRPAGQPTEPGATPVRRRSGSGLRRARHVHGGADRGGADPGVGLRRSRPPRPGPGRPGHRPAREHHPRSAGCGHPGGRRRRRTGDRRDGGGGLRQPGAGGRRPVRRVQGRGRDRPGGPRRGGRGAAFPAAHPQVLSVAATGPGGIPAKQAAGGRVDLTAPGEAVMGPGPGGKGHFTASGPSYAAALVAGTAALVLGYRPELSGEALAHRLRATASGPGGRLPDPLQGYGPVDPVAAVTAVLPEEQQGGAPGLPGRARASAPGVVMPPAPGPSAAGPAWLVTAAAFAVGLGMAGAAVVVPGGRRRGWRPGRYRAPAADGNRGSEP
nr:S8 family serine peptidase [Streptomyces sp. NBC_00162]